MSLFFAQFKINFASRRKITSLVFVLFLVLFASSVNFAQEEDEDDQSAEAILIFNKGQDAHEKGDLQAAIKFYDEAIKLAPEFPEVEFQRGNALLVLGRANAAETAFRRAI